MIVGRVIVTCVGAFQEPFSTTEQAKQATGLAMPHLMKLWVETDPTCKPAKVYYLACPEGGYAPAEHGPVRHLTPVSAGGFRVAFSMTDDPNAEASEWCTWVADAPAWAGEQN